jgi:hypothetical protein
MAGLVLVFLAVLAIPIIVGIRNPDVKLPDFHAGPPTAMMQAYNLAATQHRREVARFTDFYAVLHLMAENYPFFGLLEGQTIEAYNALVETVLENLEDEARYNASPVFLAELVNGHMMPFFGGIGNPRLVVEQREPLDWIAQPYFYGFYNWQFTDDRFDTPVREDNLTFAKEDGFALVTVQSFLPKGYEDVTRQPFWHFQFEQEREKWWDIYSQLNEDEPLVIDIRGIANGFGDYFLPFILAPLVHETMRADFYGFYMSGWYGRYVSNAFRAWYGLGEVVGAHELAANFTYPLPWELAHGFAVPLRVVPVSDVQFNGDVWLLTDSANFSGPNFMYLQMARDAGFTIIYEENPYSEGWATSFARLPFGSAVLRFNPIFFTNHEGKPLEIYKPEPHYLLTPNTALREILF